MKTGRPAGDERVSINVRLLPATIERLDVQAHKRIVSRNLLIDRACRDWLDLAEAATVDDPEDP